MKKYTLIPFDPYSDADKGFCVEVLRGIKERWANDTFKDENEQADRMVGFMRQKNALGFIGFKDGKPVAVMTVDLLLHDVGQVHGGLLLDCANGRDAIFFLKGFILYCFQGLKLRKLEARLPTFNRVTEKLLRHCGFKKEGISKEAITINGKPKTILVLALTRNEYEGAA